MAAEIRRSRYSLDVEDIRLQTTSKWPGVTAATLLKFRSLAVLYHIFTLYLSFCVEGGFRWYFLLTTWTHLAVILYFSSGAWLSLEYVVHEAKQDGKKGNDVLNRIWSTVSIGTGKSYPKFFLLKLHWLNLNLATMSSLVITCLHWTVVQDYSKLHFNLEAFCLVDRHGFNLIFLLLDLVWSDMPIKRDHVVYSWIFCVVYTSCNFLVYLLADLVIYDLVDYRNHPIFSFVFFVGGLVIIIPLGQLFMYEVYRYRCRKLEEIKGRED